MDANPNFELLKDAYAIIDGIPDDRVSLHSIMSVRGESLACGTICCAAGWLAHHPKFQVLGLGVLSDGSRLTFKEMQPYGSYVAQIAQLFNLPEIDAEVLFNMRQHHEWQGDWADLTQKQVFLRRVREYLQRHGAL